MKNHITLKLQMTRKLLITLLAITSIEMMNAESVSVRIITISQKPTNLTSDQATLQKMYTARSTDNPKFIPIPQFNTGNPNKLGIYQTGSEIAQIRDDAGNISYKFNNVQVCYSTKNNPCTATFKDPNREVFGYMWKENTDVNTFTALHGIPAAVN